MSSFKTIEDTIKEEAAKNNDKVRTSQGRYSLFIWIETGIIDGSWRIAMKDMTSSMSLNNLDVTNIEDLSHCLDKMKNYSSMLNGMQRGLINE